MSQAKDDIIRKEEAQEAAARAKGRICARCGATIPFDDIEETGAGMY